MPPCLCSHSLLLPFHIIRELNPFKADPPIFTEFSSISVCQESCTKLLFFRAPSKILYLLLKRCNIIKSSNSTKIADLCIDSVIPNSVFHSCIKNQRMCSCFSLGVLGSLGTWIKNPPSAFEEFALK